jgi:hypothetical protein
VVPVCSKVTDFSLGAGDGTRTRANLLGRQALYQLSYSRGHMFTGRGERTRTSDLSVPNAARYQAAPHPVGSVPFEYTEPAL